MLGVTMIVLKAKESRPCNIGQGVALSVMEFPGICLGWAVTITLQAKSNRQRMPKS